MGMATLASVIGGGLLGLCDCFVRRPAMRQRRA